ncbi:MAG: Smr/MutS family protein [Chloroflexi bacterium]|jgi:DNA-nicking Smr family endonuclease|nr:Smr/MutS family protein [Chloroflexota bacterium]MDA1282506.1 Smr/MutS family protein [Chloroflexota bacterium]
MSLKRRRRPKPTSEQQAWESNPNASSNGYDAAEIEIDLHGMRAHEAETAILVHLQHCLNSRLHIAKINHGHGTGVLKQLSRDILTKSDLVVRHYAAPYGDGGDGVTIAELNYGGHKAFNRRANNEIVPKALPRK